MVKRVFTTIDGMVIGLICGTVLGVVIGGLLDLILGQWFGWRWIFGGVTGIATGLVVGAGTGLLGVRTRYGLEWLPIIVVAIPLGFIFMKRNWVWNNLLLLAVIGALAGWLTALILKSAFGKWLPRGSFKYWMVAGYLVLFAALAFITPRLVQLLAQILSF